MYTCTTGMFSRTLHAQHPVTINLRISPRFSPPVFYRDANSVLLLAARGGARTVSLSLGANREGKERVKGKANRILRSQLGSALVCVRRNVQHRELNSLNPRHLCSLLSPWLLCPPVGPPIPSSPSLLSPNPFLRKKLPASHSPAWSNGRSLSGMGLTWKRWCCAGGWLRRLDVNTCHRRIYEQYIIIVSL